MPITIVTGRPCIRIFVRRGGSCGEGGEKDGGNGVGVGYDVKGIIPVSVVVWEKELVGDGVNAKSTREIPSSGSEKYCRDYGAS